MAFLEEHVSDVLIGRVDHETLNRSDPAVSGMHGVTTVDIHLTERDAVAEDRTVMLPAGRHGDAVVRPHRRVWAVSAGIGVLREEVSFVRVVEFAKLRDRAAQSDLIVRDLLHQVGRHQAAKSGVVAGGHRQVSELLSHRVDYHANNLATSSVARENLGADPQRLGLSQHALCTVSQRRASIISRHGASLSRALIGGYTRRQHTQYEQLGKVIFVRYACAFVICTGGFGTLDELFEALTLIQTATIERYPVMLVGDGEWDGLLDWLRAKALADCRINQDDLAGLHHGCDSRRGRRDGRRGP
jgi:hypothetical protein